MIEGGIELALQVNFNLSGALDNSGAVKPCPLGNVT